MERLFLIIQLSTITLFFVIGSILYRMGAADLLLDKRRYDVIQTTFTMDEEKPVPPPPKKEPPKPPEVKKSAETVPVVIEEVKEKEPEPEPEPEPDPEPARPDEPPPPPDEPKPRKVYGQRRVYSQGLGAGGSAGDAIVGRRGNTLNKAFDTLTATDADMRGTKKKQAAPSEPTTSAATVTKLPRLKAGFRSRRPQYSKDMLENRVEGAVRARILIGSDGKVKQVEIQSDIGYDSAEIAEQFLLTLEFEPAMRGEESVSVWIPFSIRFELI